MNINISLHFLLLIDVSLVFPFTPALSATNFWSGDMCRWQRGKKLYLEEGETGSIRVGNVSVPQAQRDQSPGRCSLVITTCSDCHFVIRFNSLRLPPCSNDGSCRCDYIWIKEPGYGSASSYFCGFYDNETDHTYTSAMKQVTIEFFYTTSHLEPVALEVHAVRNLYTLRGQPRLQSSVNSTGYIQSPHFPEYYPKDYSAEFLLQNNDSFGRVVLLFEDFLLSHWSYIEVFDSNGSRIDVYHGYTFRPPVIVSAGSKLSLHFHANGESSIGFKAKYTFIGYLEDTWRVKPITDCGGFVDNFGGTITMVNMADSIGKLYDCVWLLKPPKTYNYKTHLSLKVAQFHNMAADTVLEIRKGLTSESPHLETMIGRDLLRTTSKELLVPVSIGFYVRLNGFVDNTSTLAVVYAAFNYMDCYRLLDFLCHNHRCIRRSLRCDDFDHCGDGSDEPATCFGSGTSAPPNSPWWYTRTPNYYFPRHVETPSALSMCLALISSTLGLALLIMGTIVLMYRFSVRNRDVLDRGPVHTIAGTFGVVEERTFEDPPSDLPPVYDPPPTYEDVIKFFLPSPPPNYVDLYGGGSRGSPTTSSRSETPSTESQARSLRVRLTELFTCQREVEDPTERNKNENFRNLQLPSLTFRTSVTTVSNSSSGNCPLSPTSSLVSPFDLPTSSQQVSTPNSDIFHPRDSFIGRFQSPSDSFVTPYVSLNESTDRIISSAPLVLANRTVSLENIPNCPEINPENLAFSQHNRLTPGNENPPTSAIVDGSEDNGQSQINRPSPNFPTDKPAEQLESGNSTNASPSDLLDDVSFDYDDSHLERLRAENVEHKIDEIVTEGNVDSVHPNAASVSMITISSGNYSKTSFDQTSTTLINETDSSRGDNQSSSHAVDVNKTVESNGHEKQEIQPVVNGSLLIKQATLPSKISMLETCQCSGACACPNSKRTSSLQTCSLLHSLSLPPLVPRRHAKLKRSNTMEHYDDNTKSDFEGANSPKQQCGMQYDISEERSDTEAEVSRHPMSFKSWTLQKIPGYGVRCNNREKGILKSQSLNIPSSHEFPNILRSNISIGDCNSPQKNTERHQE